METKQFTSLQLFSIVDGRLSTTISDLYDILNHITGESLMTHHLPVAMDYVKEINPKWFVCLKEVFKGFGISKEKDFLECIEIVKANNLVYDIPPLTTEQKEGFGEYMVDNSLLLKKVNAKP